MEHNLSVFNSLTRKKEKFVPLHPDIVGMYVCGPTVYGPGHLGHARPAITFDILFRYLRHLGYKVRYVRNITDVGHLEHDADDGDGLKAELCKRSFPGRKAPFFILVFILFSAPYARWH